MRIFSPPRLPRPPVVLGRLRLPRPTWLRHLAVLGPGIIAANAGNDAGGIATYASVGALYGYRMLWLFIPIAVSLIVVQEMCARMGAVTGQGLLDLIRERFGPRWTTFAILTLLVANGVVTISEFAGVATAMELFGVSKYLSVPLAATAVWVLVVRGSYHRVEGIFLLLTVAFFAYPISAVLAKPDWPAVSRGLVIPTFRMESSYLLMAVALVGTTISPYMQLFVQSSVVEKGITVREYGSTRLDVVVGSLFAMAIAAAIIVCTAATLFVAGVNIETAADAARALEPIAGSFAAALFALGLLGASLLAAGVLPLATSFSITEAFGFEKGVSFSWEDAPIFYSLFTLLVAGGAAVTLIPGIPLIQLLVFVYVINGVLLPVLLVFVVRLAGDRELLGEHRNGPLYNAIAWATVLGVGALALVMVVTTVLLPLFGIHLT